MKLDDRLETFIQLGRRINRLTDLEKGTIATEARKHNGWFTGENVQNALEGISFMLEEARIRKWIQAYDIREDIPQIVGIVMAGNIPMVGFHDLMCVLISGNFAAVKPSSDDTFLTRLILDWIVEIEPRFKKNFEIREKLTEIDAVIATGSDNTARYFEYYFKDISHIIRKNRTSIAILNGHETDEELEKLGEDIFSYFGLGCRNVSKIYTPEGYALESLFPHLESYGRIIEHHKYRNNYDYHKSIYLVNKTPHLDNGFMLTVSSHDLVSPISVLYHQMYDSKENLNKVLENHEDKIQCIVGKDHLPFGHTQRPAPWDYADNIDIMRFLMEIRPKV